jgi:hypothetical protein
MDGSSLQDDNNMSPANHETDPDHMDMTNLPEQ